MIKTITKLLIVFSLIFTVSCKGKNTKISSSIKTVTSFDSSEINNKFVLHEDSKNDSLDMIFKEIMNENIRDYDVIYVKFGYLKR